MPRTQAADRTYNREEPKHTQGRVEGDDSTESEEDKSASVDETEFAMNHCGNASGRRWSVLHELPQTPTMSPKQVDGVWWADAVLASTHMKLSSLATPPSPAKKESSICTRRVNPVGSRLYGNGHHNSNIYLDGIAGADTAIPAAHLPPWPTCLAPLQKTPRQPDHPPPPYLRNAPCLIQFEMMRDQLGESLNIL